MDDLKDKRILITGAANGIGRAAAEAFAAEGGWLLLVDIDSDGLSALENELRELDVVCKSYVADISNRDAASNMAARVLSDFGGVDVLLNVAGVVVASDIADMEIEDWEWLLGVNLWGPIHMIHNFVPGMIERNSGHVVNIASAGGLFSLSMLGGYCTTKFALVGLSEALYQELAENNVGVSTICPGFTRTSIARKAVTRGFSYDKVNRLASRFMNLPGSLSTEKTAEYIVNAVKGEKRIVVTTVPAKVLCFLNRVSPGLFNRLLLWGRGINTKKFR